MFVSFVQLRDITCLLLSSIYMMSNVCFFQLRNITCLLLSYSYVNQVFASFVQLSDVTCMLLPVTWCHVFASFFHLHDVTCLLLLPVTWYHVFASFVHLHDITCLLLSASCVISCFLLWSFPFFFVSSIYFHFPGRCNSSVSVVTRKWEGRPKNRGSIPSGDKVCFSSP